MNIIRKKSQLPTVSELCNEYEKKYNFKLSQQFKTHVHSSMYGKKMNRDRELNIRNLIWGAYLQQLN